MVGMKLCPAQLRHQNGAMTAGPHAARVSHTGSLKEILECFHSSTKCSSHEVNSIKPNSLTNNSRRPPSPPPNQFTQSDPSQRDIHIEMLVVTLLLSTLPPPPTTLITSVISSSFPFASLTSQRSCFLVLRAANLVVSPPHPLIPIIQLSGGGDQQESVNNSLHMGAPM